MKNLLFVIMAILLINVSFAGEVGENEKVDCKAYQSGKLGSGKVASTDSSESNDSGDSKGK